MDVLIHSVCAFTFHAVCGVSVHIKGKRRGLMSEIFLHSLDVIAGLQAVYGVSMTEIMILQPSNLRAGCDTHTGVFLFWRSIFPRCAAVS